MRKKNVLKFPLSSCYFRIVLSTTHGILGKKLNGYYHIHTCFYVMKSSNK